eukprot:TRINITY_DN2377_c8_g1_i1.p1 TRINITY_DN2377_c8_g1~~TRINITY_DN2377_c8_g1_i1.p1  ORF type:complete len:261 (+),score=54.34 TRINITY_DN2377_c8_g1_i1:72-854(+)
MPQNEHIELARKRHGYRLDHFERERKREARLVHKRAEFLQKVKGGRAKLVQKARYQEKAEMKKKIKAHEEKQSSEKKADVGPKHAVPAYMMDRENINSAKIRSETVKQKRKEKAGKWDVPIPKVKAMTEDDMFKVMKSGKRQNSQWKRMINKASFVGENFTRKSPKYERFIRPMALRFKKAHVTHPELKTTFCLPIIGVKKNPQSRMYTTLGVITRGTIVEVNTSELGLVTPGGKIVWGKYAQVTNHPENDGCINALLLV